MYSDPRIKKLKEAVEKDVFATRKQQEMVAPDGTDLAWIFDFKRILLRPETLDLVSELFWERFEKEYPFQVGGLESASIPLIAGIVMKSVQKGKPVHGFFIRKSRKKSGLLRMIEGELTDEKIILVDDLVNHGWALMRQVEVLEGLGKKVSAIFVILRYRDESYYDYFRNKGIRIFSLFTLDNFTHTLKVKNLVDAKAVPTPMPFKVAWYFKSNNPNYFYVVPKSAPAIDAEKLYFGGDNGSFWAVNQNDGSVAWKHRIFFGSRGKMIFSSPALHNRSVYFGAYDGNLYALDTETGKKKWIFMDADWIGSSPCVAPDLNLVFVGLEFGLWKKEGGIVALDADTGKKKWEYPLPGLTHSSPAYSKEHSMVVCGCNDFSVYAFNARNGKLLWEFETRGEVKASFAFDEERSLVAFGSFDRCVYVVRTQTGELVHKIETDEAIYSTPRIHAGYLYVASLDKHLYCIDLETGSVIWKFETQGRIFASPEIVGDKVYIGSNDGRLYELDAKTGAHTALFQATERITNKVAYNAETEKLFLPTFANEIYCLSKA